MRREEIRMLIQTSGDIANGKARMVADPVVHAAHSADDLTQHTPTCQVKAASSPEFKLDRPSQHGLRSGVQDHEHAAKDLDCLGE